MLKYVVKVGLSIAAAAILTGLIWVLQWISWWALFGILVISIAPLAHYCVKLWTEEDCYDLEDFVLVLSEKPWQNPPEENKPPKNNNRIE